MAEYVWRGVEIDGLERLRLSADGDGLLAESVIDSARGRYSYDLRIGPGWVVRSLRVEALAGRRVLLVGRDDEGAWTVDGAARGDLDECIDVDISGTPFTNTLPIRRHPLEVGDEAEFWMAWIDLDELTVQADPQRYTRLDDDLYLFESLDGDFEREITVDRDGFVVDYPGLFERL